MNILKDAKNTFKDAKNTLANLMAMTPHKTTNHNFIQEWAEVRGGIPARDLKDQDFKCPKIVFDEKEINAYTQKISWEEFFELFEAINAVFFYSEEDMKKLDEPLSCNYRIEKNARK